MSTSPFFQACGGREALRLTIGGAEPVEFFQPVVIVGSNPRADVVLPGGADKSLLFALIEGRLFALPLASTEPVLCNDELCRPGWVELDDEFQVNNVRVQAVNPRQPGNSHPDYDPIASGGARDSDLHFEPLPPFRSKKNPTRLAVLPRLTLVGRSEQVKFKIGHDGIEPLHAALLRTPSGPWIVDLTLRGRTFINDNAITTARLRSGDRLGLGGVELIAHVQDRSDAVVPAPAMNDSTVAPILQEVAKFQQQTFEQFREMLGTMTQMFGSVLSEHREFVKDEFSKRDRVSQNPPPPPPALAPAPKVPKPIQPTPHVTPIPQPAPGYAAPPANMELHSWLHDQLGNLERQQMSRWKRWVDKLRKKSRNG